MTIGENIKRIRKEKNMTQRELGESLGGISQQQIGQWETGKANPKFETIIKIAYALDVDFFDIVDIDEVQPSETSNTTIFADEINGYVQEIGEFLYYNPNHRPLFDSVMEVKQSDIELTKLMLDKINGKLQDLDQKINSAQSRTAAHTQKHDQEQE